MLKDLLKQTWLTKDEILLQINDEFARGFQYVSPIRQEFQKEDKLFINEKKKKDKLWDFTYFSVYSALMARSYVNSPEAKFEKTVWKEDIIDKLNNVIEQDFEETDMETLKYFRDSNKFKRWVGIIAKTWWDWENKRGKFTNIDPRLWIPDPDADYINGKFWFCWFQDDIYKVDLENLSNTEVIDFDNLSQKQETKWSKWLKDQDKRNNNLVISQTNNTYNPNYDIYYHFSYFNWQPAMIMLANDKQVILKVVVYKWISKAEKNNPALIPLPFAFTYWIPDNTPFGMRVPMFTADAQKSKAIMNNLRMDKELAELYPMYLRNSRLLPNAWDIEFGFNKILDVNAMEWESIDNALRPVQKDFRSDNSFQIEQSIDRNIASATSIGKVAQGSTPSRRETATTNSLVQDNTDINLALAEKVEAWWEKQLILLILRAYQENFLDWDIKQISYKTSYWVIWLSLKKKDFLSETALHIVVKTKTDLNKQKEKEKLALWNAIGMIQTLPMSESSKKFLYREYFEVLWLDKQKAERIVDYTPEEIKAMQNIELLNAWIELEVFPEYDPLVHLAALKSAKPWLNVDMYRSWLLALYEAKGGWQQWNTWLVPWSEWIANNMAAQSMSNISNEMSNLQNNQ